MIRRHRSALVAIAAAVALTTAACGGDDTPQESTSASTSASAAPTTSTSRAIQPGTGPGAVQPGTESTTSESVQPGLATQPAPIGPAQTVTTSDGTSIITVYSPSLYVDAKDGERALLVPVTIDVQSGTIEATSAVWRARTQSGIEIFGTTGNTISTAVGTGDLTGRIEGDLYISGSYQRSSDYLKDNVAITEFALYAPSAYGDTPPLATFTLPQPIKVSDLPRRQS